MKTIKCSDVDGGEHEVPVEKLSHRPSVYGIIIQDGKILLSPQFSDGYDFPGGGMDMGETIEETLIREVKEETGLAVVRKDVVACEHSFFKLPFVGRYVSTILIYYLCNVVGGEVTDAYLDKYEKEYAKKAQWVELSKIEELKFYNSVDSQSIIHRAQKIIRLGDQ